MNKSEQNLTKKDAGAISKNTGLTPKQEEAAIMLASGMTISIVADKLAISRTTLYQWHTLLPFQCFLNGQCGEVKSHLSNSMLAMCDDAIEAIRKSLNSDNESVRLKCAMWLIESIHEREIGEVNPFEAIKKESMEIPDAWAWDDQPKLNERLYESNLMKYGLSKPD